MNTMQAAARRLHALGFKTLPIKPNSKEPATKHGVKDATADDALTDAFYETHPNYGIGVSGDGFVIFDFDALDVGRPHPLVDAPRGERGGQDGARGKGAAHRPHGNAHPREAEERADHGEQNRRTREQQGRGKGAAHRAFAPG